jgi:hypothetical protein
MAMISRSLKYEDSKNRLLLSADVFSYILFCFVLNPIEKLLGEDPNIDFSSDTFRTWADFAKRYRGIASKHMMRLWDYENFN